MPARFIWVGSRLHETDRDLLQNLLPSECILERVDSRSKFSAMAQYANSKLLFIMFVSGVGPADRRGQGHYQFSVPEDSAQST